LLLQVEGHRFVFDHCRESGLCSILDFVHPMTVALLTNAIGSDSGFPTLPPEQHPFVVVAREFTLSWHPPWVLAYNRVSPSRHDMFVSSGRRAAENAATWRLWHDRIHGRYASTDAEDPEGGGNSRPEAPRLHSTTPTAALATAIPSMNAP
jgi:hypothetical protein